MLQLAKASQVTALRDQLFRTFTQSGCEKQRRKLSDPSGGIGEVELFWNPKLGIWAYFNKSPHRHSRWFCWFGSEIGEPQAILTPSVEINLTTNPTNKLAGGRSLVDANNNFYLGHKGLLGGGRGGQMSKIEFGHRIRGFVREPITTLNGDEESIFVLGNVKSNRTLDRIRDFVLECDRLRKIARLQNNDAARTRRSKVKSPKTGIAVFRAENDRDGATGGGWSEPKTIKRIHGRVVNALQKTVGPRAINGTRSSMRPDLYVLNSSGDMQIIFEVKASSDSQSWFTALGQLIVYSAAEMRRPKRVLVCPAPREDLNFVKALTSLGISLVTFTAVGQKFCFDGLETVLKSSL